MLDAHIKIITKLTVLDNSIGEAGITFIPDLRRKGESMALFAIA